MNGILESPFTVEIDTQKNKWIQKIKGKIENELGEQLQDGDNFIQYNREIALHLSVNMVDEPTDFDLLWVICEGMVITPFINKENVKEVIDWFRKLEKEDETL